MEGTIVKAISGFYYVNCDNTTIECKPRGIFRKNGISPLVGDKVEITVDNNSKGTIETIKERKNFFIRPSVANLDQMVIIVSEAIPKTEPILIDRLITSVSNLDVEPIIVINKVDLNRGDDLYNLYSEAGYTTILVSAKTLEGIEKLKEVLKGKISAFTGNSGVGKSSIINCLDPNKSIKIGEISEKLGRGKHTTRHVELYELTFGAYIVDTPGFSSFESDEQVNYIRKEKLQYTYKEFEPYLGLCKFSDCAHIKEKGCAILDAVQNGKISKIRHENYVKLYQESGLIKDWEIK